MSEALRRESSSGHKPAGGGVAARVETFMYDNAIVRAFAIATVIWGIVGMAAGMLAATQIFYPAANLNLQFITFGRLRPLHTNAVIFAFIGNGMFMGIYYSLQRLCKARMFSDWLSWLNFWGWQAIIVSAAITLPLGLTGACILPKQRKKKQKKYSKPEIRKPRKSKRPRFRIFCCTVSWNLP